MLIPIHILFSLLALPTNTIRKVDDMGIDCSVRRMSTDGFGINLDPVESLHMGDGAFCRFPGDGVVVPIPNVLRMLTLFQSSSSVPFIPECSISVFFKLICKFLAGRTGIIV